jgi:sugar/nucleoside kinase (ribokinase family)
MNHFIPDYLLIGHIAHDVTPDGPRLGGTVSFGAHTAARFGLRVGLLTSARPDEPLLNDLPKNVQVICVPAEHTTTFDNRYAPDGKRTQYMYHRARTLTPEMLPDTWSAARLVQFGSISYEIDPAFAPLFAEQSLCVTVQGFMRHREPDGLIKPIRWDAAEQVLPRARITVLSEEDIRHNPSLEAEFARLCPLVIVTRAERGGTIYRQGHRSEFEATKVKVVNPTGAGDVFGTALHIALDRLGDLDRAIKVAAYLGGQSVTRSGFDSAPLPEEVTRAWRMVEDKARHES